MLMGSVGCRSTQRHQKRDSSIFASWKTRTRRENSHRSSILLLISANKRYRSSFTTVTITSPVAAYAWRSRKVVPSVRWRAIMATVRRRRGPCDTLSVDIVGPLPADHRQKFLIVFVDCYSRYTILVPSRNHTASTVSEALLRHVVPYLEHLAAFCLTEVENLWEMYGAN